MENYTYKEKADLSLLLKVRLGSSTRPATRSKMNADFELVESE